MCHSWDLKRLDSKDDWTGRDTIEFFHFEEGFLELAEGAGVKKEDHFEEVGVRVVGVDRGVGSGNADFVFCENGGDVCDDAGLVVDGETDVVRGFVS